MEAFIAAAILAVAVAIFAAVRLAYRAGHRAGSKDTMRVICGVEERRVATRQRSIEEWGWRPIAPLHHKSDKGGCDGG